MNDTTDHRLPRRVLLALMASIPAAAVLANSPVLARAQALGDDYPWRGQGTNVGYSVWHISGRPDNPATGYYWRNCTDFVADRIFRTTGLRIPRTLGNAVSWGTRAGTNGFQVDGEPRRGSVAWFNNSTYGHVGVVAEARSDGSILVENYNNTPGGVPNGAYYQSTHRRGVNWPAGFIHFRDLESAPQPIRDGDFISHGGHVYRIAGGAPIYVSSWAHLGGEKPVRALSAAEFNGLRTHPVDGTLISGQAPGHAEHGTVYVIAGGAPIYVASFDHVGKNKPVINVDLAAIHRAGDSGPWARLRRYPSNGTLISGQASGHTEHGTVYVIAGGAPIYVTSFDHVGKNQPVTNVSLAAIHNSGGTGVWNHLRRRPADGTVVSGQAPGKPGHGTVFVIAGGAPICVYNWANIGGSRTATSIDLIATENAGKSGRWQYLLNYPADGTILLGYGSGKHYRVSKGRPQELPSPTSADKGRAVPVDQQAIDRAGQPLTHLLGPQSAGGGTLPSDGTTPPAGGSSFGS
ncbi:MAG: CHAP domain-containing protein [Dietzia cercidiphylli]